MIKTLFHRLHLFPSFQGLDTETLAICVRLIEQGVNPEALALVIKELRREREDLIKEGNLPGGDGSLA